jgi:hypothetical protein
MQGGVMPYCCGSVCQNIDRFDLAHLDLVNRTATLIALLRDQRRQRRAYTQGQTQAVRRLRQLSLMMRDSGDVRGHQQAWREVERLAQSLSGAAIPDAPALKPPPTATPKMRVAPPRSTAARDARPAANGDRSAQ